MNRRTAAQAPSSSNGEGLHNSVLIRTHEPPASDHGRLYAAVMGVALVMGIAAWVYVSTHSGPPIVNHAVAAASASPTP
jgi:hypothetical protein